VTNVDGGDSHNALAATGDQNVKTALRLPSIIYRLTAIRNRFSNRFPVRSSITRHRRRRHPLLRYQV